MLENVLPAWKEKVEKEKASEIAKNLLKIGMTVEKIIEATGLAKEDILVLKTQNTNA